MILERFVKSEASYESVKLQHTDDEFASGFYSILFYGNDTF